MISATISELAIQNLDHLGWWLGASMKSAWWNKAHQFEVASARLHLDRSSMSVEGRYLQPEMATTPEAADAAESPCPIQITYGYSRDRRPDLKQFLLDTSSSEEGDVPLSL